VLRALVYFSFPPSEVLKFFRAPKRAQSNVRRSPHPYFFPAPPPFPLTRQSFACAASLAAAAFFIRRAANPQSA
jgi:hypothetical protein